MQLLQEIAQKIKDQGGQAFLVGGCVRDKLLGIVSKDIDVEVYGLSLDRLKDILSLFGPVDLVGKSFGVLKIKGTNIDFALPRQEIKVGKGHKGFKITLDPFSSFKDAAKRRDFTINAILENILTSEIIDPFDGLKDLNRGLIRHIDTNSFPEDPLRVYRAAQFAGRFQFTIHPETIELCSTIDLKDLPKERVFAELEKLLVQGTCPSLGLKALEKMNVIQNYHPLLNALIGCEQDKVFHPEGDVWQHTLLVVDEAARLRHLSRKPTALMLAALCHDLGKPYSRQIYQGKITNYGHAEKGAQLTEEFLLTITDNKKLIKDTVSLVLEHMIPYALYKQNASLKALGRLIQRVDVHELLILAEADFKGRGSHNLDFTPVKEWFQEKFRALEMDSEQKIKPLVTGKDLIALGLTPGKHFKVILDKALDLQLEGLSKEEILKKLKT